MNPRLLVTYNGFRLGGNGCDGFTTDLWRYYLDASERPLVFDRAGGKFRFSADVLAISPDATASDQSSFHQMCAALEAAFDPKANPNGALRIETDAKAWESFDRCGSHSFELLQQPTNGDTFTVTVNGTAHVLTAGTDFAVGASLEATAIALATAINTLAVGAHAILSTHASDKSQILVYVQTDSRVYAITLACSASGAVVSVTNDSTTTGFNAVPSISKEGSDEDTARSRRYRVEVVLELPHTESGKNGLREAQIQIRETDSRQQLLTITGAYTALGSSTALEQYASDADTFAGLVQDALGGDWEGPFDVQATPVLEYAFPTDGSRKLGTVLRFSRSYQELIYARSLADDVRLRRARLEVRVATPAPGDYGPNGVAVFRLRTVSVEYDAAVDKTATQDLKGVYATVVKPFLAAEARKALDGDGVALVNQEARLDRTRNRIACRLEYLAAIGSIVESSVSTQDEDQTGVQLVGVWSGNPLAKQKYDGLGRLRRTVTQTYTTLAGSGAGGGGASAAFGAFSPNQPTAWFLIQETSPLETAIDDFFLGGQTAFVHGSAGGDGSFPTSGGVPEPAGLERAYVGGVVTTKPVTIGRPGDPQLKLTVLAKAKVYDYYVPAPAPSAPAPTKTGGGGGASNRQITPGASGFGPGLHGPAGDSAGGPLK